MAEGRKADAKCKMSGSEIDMLQRSMAVVLWCLFLGVSALGDGGFLPPHDYSGADLREPCQRAILVHRDGRESLILYVDYVGSAADFAWVIPAPSGSPPDVSIASVDLLREVADYFHHLQMIAWRKEMREARLRDRNGGFGAAGSGGPAEEQVVVYQCELLGPYEVAVLSAEGEDALLEWLSRHRYRVNPSARSILGQYIEEEWYFVAVRVRTSRKEIQTLPPLQLEFLTARPVYPLRISAMNRGVTDIRIYSFQAQSEAERNAGSSRYDRFRLRPDFASRCPEFSRAFPGVRGEGVLLFRTAETYASPVLARLDDYLHGLQGAGAGVGYRLYAPESLAVSLGTIEALLSDDSEERTWARARISRFATYIRPTKTLPNAGLVAFRNLGRQLGDALRDTLLEYPERYVEQVEQGGLLRGRMPEPGERARRLASCPNEVEGAVALLALTCEPSDPQVLSLFGEVCREAGGGSFWGDAVCALGSSASRRILARLALSNRDVGAVYRYVSSLEQNRVDPLEEATASRELLFLFASGAVPDAKGKLNAAYRGMRLLRLYTGESFGEDWERWAEHLGVSLHAGGLGDGD